jgi:hypothetical protein
MSTLNTITAQAIEPWASKPTDFTPPYVEVLQTSGSGATSGGLEVFGDPAVSDNFFLTNIQVSITDPTSGSLWSLYVGLNLICTFPTCAADTPQFHSLNFGNPGCAGDVTTTTATVSLFSSGGTATTIFYAQGSRKL